LPLFRLTRTYHALVSTVAAFADDTWAVRNAPMRSSDERTASPRLRGDRT
jgi:hypothetical protein